MMPPAAAVPTATPVAVPIAAAPPVLAATPPKLLPLDVTPVTAVFTAIDFALLNIDWKADSSNVTPFALHIAFAFFNI